MNDQQRMDAIEAELNKRDLELSFQREKMASKYLRHNPVPNERNWFIAGGIRFGHFDYDSRGYVRISEAGTAYIKAREHSKQVEINYFMAQSPGKTYEQLEKELGYGEAREARHWAAFRLQMIRLGREPRIL